MLTRSGDTAAGTTPARADALPPEKYSLTLRLPMAEVEQSGASAPSRAAPAQPEPGSNPIAAAAIGALGIGGWTADWAGR